jgi:hypothetical protein
MAPFIASLVRAVLVWMLFILAESVQGALRRTLVSPGVEMLVRQSSVVVGVVLIFAITWFAMRWLRIRSNAGALAVGVFWVALTVAFEVVLGRVMGAPWSRILGDYDLSQGSLMPLGLLAMALTPWMVRRLQRRRPAADGAHP